MFAGPVMKVRMRSSAGFLLMRFTLMTLFWSSISDIPASLGLYLLFEHNFFLSNLIRSDYYYSDRVKLRTSISLSFLIIHPYVFTSLIKFHKKFQYNKNLYQEIKNKIKYIN